MNQMKKEELEITTSNSDRIECAIRHIESSLDVDKWARDIAVNAMEKQIPKKVRITTSTKRCGNCGRQLFGIGNLYPKTNFCVNCGQKICWEDE